MGLVSLPPSGQSFQNRDSSEAGLLPSFALLPQGREQDKETMFLKQILNLGPRTQKLPQKRIQSMNMDGETLQSHFHYILLKFSIFFSSYEGSKQNITVTLPGILWSIEVKKIFVL